MLPSKCSRPQHTARFLMNVGLILQFDGPIILVEQRLNSTRVHQFCFEVLPGIFMGSALNAGRRRTDDLFISDTEDRTNDATVRKSCKKIIIKRGGHPKKRQRIFYCRAGLTNCKHSSRHPSLYRGDAAVGVHRRGC